MEFTLHYRGLLKSNRGADEKLALRRHFHRQLSVLWEQKPLIGYRGKLIDRTHEEPSLNVVQTIQGFNFAPLIAERLQLVAELEISLLRPEAPGQIVNQGGDIDNRLKTLLDSLTVPRSPNALPSDAQPLSGEDPFFCLLEDDNLITRVAVTSDRLLEPNVSPSEVIVQIHVRTKHITVLMGTIGLG